MCICVIKQWFHWQWPEMIWWINSDREVCISRNPIHATRSFTYWKRIFCFETKVVGEREDSSTGMRGVYVDYRMRRVTSFDVFNDLFGNYSGPMLSDLLKKKGIKPPRYITTIRWYTRKLVDRIQILVDAIDDKMRSTYIVRLAPIADT